MRYGNYYKVFKGNGGIPEKITVVEIDGDTVTFINGHCSKEQLKYSSLPIKMKCKTEAILTHITDKQKKILEDRENKFNSLIEKADKALQKFKN